jgi:peptidoglycan/LPS O-acetylase OafA/YrhL
MTWRRVLATTFLDRMELTSGRSSGFDYMRVLLAMTIIGVHTVMTSYGAATQVKMLEHPLGRPLLLLVPMFFSLSGFLVAGSWERCRTIFSFLGLRVLRIFPALTLQALISTLIVGPIFTILPLSIYFHDPLLIRFFWNAIGHTEYLLPGVFINNPDLAVNGQLWTVPWELDCYLILSVLAVVGVMKRRLLLVLALAIVQALLTIHAFFMSHGESMSLSGILISVCFMWGLALYRYRDRVPWKAELAAVSFAVSYIGLMLPDGKYLITLPVAYFTTYLGLLNPPRDRWLLSGDYSYGLYVFGYPVQQAVANFPELRVWWINLFIALPGAFVIAWLSWRLVEHPALGLRGRLVDLEDGLVRLMRWPRTSRASPLEVAKVALAQSASALGDRTTIGSSPPPAVGKRRI